MGPRILTIWRYLNQSVISMHSELRKKVLSLSCQYYCVVCALLAHLSTIESCRCHHGLFVAARISNGHDAVGRSLESAHS